jgi:hypothetical protein
MKSCFIIPIYPPHYGYLNFLDSFSSNDTDIFLILSYQRDLEELERIRFYKNYRTIILEKEIGKDLVDKIIAKNVVITFKKYYAINLLKENYKYLATCDSEIQFVNCNDVTKKFKEFCENKKIIGSIIGENTVNINLAKEINIGSTIFFDYQEISEVSNNFKFYFWFSDIPIYDSEIASEYLNFINFKEFDLFVDKISWYFFDYISYGYYCILKKGYSKIDIKEYGIDRNWSLESIPINIYNEVVDKIGYKPLWVINDTWKENVDSLKEKIILSYHLNDGRYTIL